MRDLLKREWRKVQAGSDAPSVPAIIWRLAKRLLGLASSFMRGKRYFRNASWKGSLVFAKGRPTVQQLGRLELGHLVRIWSNINPTQIIVGKQGVLSIGDGAYINGALIAVEKEVSIGKNCYLAPMVQIMDTDDFGLGMVDAQGAKSVIIEEDAWLATRAMVTKGVRIGKGAVVAVGAVVQEDVAPYTLVAGVPARPIRKLRAI
ncbi:MAG: hypothetical protein KTR30_32685 [Saprospiraceae bacterium]|nr:hypothetical protein [Saprospiraceae bacterium]